MINPLTPKELKSLPEISRDNSEYRLIFRIPKHRNKFIIYSNMTTYCAIRLGVFNPKSRDWREYSTLICIDQNLLTWFEWKLYPESRKMSIISVGGIGLYEGINGYIDKFKVRFKINLTKNHPFWQELVNHIHNDFITNHIFTT